VRCIGKVHVRIVQVAASVSLSAGDLGPHREVSRFGPQGPVKRDIGSFEFQNEFFHKVDFLIEMRFIR